MKMAPLTVDEVVKQMTDPRNNRINVGKDVTREQIEAALAHVDQQSIIDKADVSFTKEVWDGQSPINGVAASVVRRRHKLGVHNSCYLIKNSDGRAIIFQPFKPGIGGHQPMSPEEAAQIGDETRQSVANDRARQHIISQVVQHLLK